MFHLDFRGTQHVISGFFQDANPERFRVSSYDLDTSISVGFREYAATDSELPDLEMSVFLSLEAAKMLHEKLGAAIASQEYGAECDRCGGRTKELLESPDRCEEWCRQCHENYSNHWGS